MSVLELEKLVESLSDTEKAKLRELLNSSVKPTESHPDLSWLDKLQAEARAACEAEGARPELPTDLAATFRQRKRDSLFGPSEPRE